MCVIARLTRSLCASAVVLAVGAGVWYVTKTQPKSVPLEPTAAAAAAPTKEGGDAPFAQAASGKSDHLMFGGTNGRNMVNLIDSNVPGSFKLEEATKWKAQLGSRAYGGPIVSQGKIFIGTNNFYPRNKRDRGKPTDDAPDGPPLDKGVVMCFTENSGDFLWQAIHDKLPRGQANDWPLEGICSTPIVEGNRVYYVSNRCTVVCADVNGFLDGKNDGMAKEKYQDKTDVDIIWEFDMMKDENVYPHNMSACSPLIVGDTIFVITANGVDEEHVFIPSPEAPSFIALNKNTGKLLWKDSSPGKRIMHGQWSNPTYAVIKDVPQVIFPGGDGWIYSFNPKDGKPLWKFDANPKGSKYELGGKGTKSDFIGTPVVYDNKIFIGTGQDPEHSPGVGHFWCIDPAGKNGDISPDLVTDDSVDPPVTKVNPNSGVVWHYGGNETRNFAKRDYVFSRTMSTACIVDDVLYISELDGYFNCINAKTGKRYWMYDLKSSIWGSPYYVDGKIFIGNEDGDLFVFKHEKEPKVMDEDEEASMQADEKAAGKKRLEVKKAVEKHYRIDKIAVDQPIRSTIIVANGILYIMTEQTLFAIEKK